MRRILLALLSFNTLTWGQVFFRATGGACRYTFSNSNYDVHAAAVNENMKVAAEFGLSR